MEFENCQICHLWWPKPALTRSGVCPICYGVSDVEKED